LEYLEGFPELRWVRLTSDRAFSSAGIQRLRDKNPDLLRLELKP
jgi:hypothetical protein